MATIVGDVTGPQHTATTHKIYLILLRRSKAFQNRNRFEILQHIKNSGEGSIHPHPPPHLVPGGGMNLRVRPRVKVNYKLQ